MNLFNGKFLLVIFYVILIFGIFQIKGDDEEEVPTYRTVFEKGLQGVGGAVEGAVGDVKGIVNDITGNHAPKNRTGFGDLLNQFSSVFHAIYPGTEWCGSGNIAPTNDSLGPFNKTDACCRSHDQCFSNINAGESKGRLLNNGFFTRSNCLCDHDFYRCLKKADTPVASSIGYTYFNILRPQCFALEYPIVSCEKKDSKRIVEKKCLEYNLDTKQNMTEQWFDNPDF
ncbi:phospholipase A2-like [Aphidius gifuensis]|uniref:phospholipase A2-like n=1 Tax=Aphidius gifuensis TaxID=684658 RepID=UPI001CDB4A84|nr:phospholipase A2-like [Aphidius gifuensis]